MTDLYRSLSQEFHYLAHFCKGKDLTLKELATHIGPRAQALLTLVLSIPFVLFIPLPGLSIVFGIFIMVNGVRIASNKALWFPRFLLKKRIHSAALVKTFHFAEKIAKRAEKIIRPRGKFLIKHPHLQILHGVMLAVCGFFLSLPMPLGTGFPPGLTTLFLSLGILEEDGLFVVLSYITFAATLAFFALLGFYSGEEIKHLFK